MCEPTWKTRLCNERLLGRDVQCTKYTVNLARMTSKSTRAEQVYLSGLVVFTRAETSPGRDPVLERELLGIPV